MIARIGVKLQALQGLCICGRFDNNQYIPPGAQIDIAHPAKCPYNIDSAGVDGDQHTHEEIDVADDIAAVEPELCQASTKFPKPLCVPRAP